MDKKGILAVSFGTTNLDALKNNIQSCEDALKSVFKEYEIKRAFTSGIVRKRLLQKFGLKANSVKEALEEMKNQGFQIVVVQSLHVIPGKEFHDLFEAIQNYKNHFKKIIIGKPLLYSLEDYDFAINAIIENFKNKDKDQALVLMGHGSAHPANACYSCLQLKLDERMQNIFIATMEGYPEINDIIPKLKAKKITKAFLMPFMVVAGEHAYNDLSGDNDDSWKSILTENGFKVEVVMKGLGEIKGIQEIFINHSHEAIKGMDE